MSYTASEAMAGMRSAYWKFMRENPSTLRAVETLLSMPQIKPKAHEGKTPSRFTAEQKAQCLNMSMSGMRPIDIEAKTGVPAKIVTTWRIRAGIKPLLKPRCSKALREKALALMADGYTTAQVQIATGLRKSTLSRWRGQNGIQRSKKTFKK